MKTALVAGGAGFLGSHMCDKLISENIRVICIDNLLTGQYSNIEHLISNENFTLMTNDIINLPNIVHPIDYILNFASPASPVDYLKYPMETLKVGSIGTLNLLNLAKNNNCKFLQVSTSEIYGDPKENPQSEEYWGNVNPIGIRSVYDESKRFSESLTMTFFRKYLIDTKIVRLFNTYGTRMKPDDGRAIPNFIMQALNNKDVTIYGSGNQTRSFCYVSDTIDGIYKVLMSNETYPINIGNPHEMTINNLAKKIIKYTKSNSTIVHKCVMEDDPLIRNPDIMRAKYMLKWTPIISFEEGIKKTINYFQMLKQIN